MTTSQLTPRILVAGIIAAISIGVPVTAQRVSESELLLREALHKQQVEGDLPAAIKIYQQIVSAKNADRAVTRARSSNSLDATKSWASSRKRSISRSSAISRDQPVAVQARARLAALRSGRRRRRR